MPAPPAGITAQNPGISPTGAGDVPGSDVSVDMAPNPSCPARSRADRLPPPIAGPPIGVGPAAYPRLVSETARPPAPPPDDTPDTPAEPDARGTLRTDRPLDLRATLAPLRHGGGDPTTRLRTGEVWRACATPSGDATVRIVQHGRYDVVAEAWGAGATWLIESLPRLLGEDDDWSGLDLVEHPRLVDVRRRHEGLRLPATGLVMDSLVPAIIEQRVTGMQAFASWRNLVHFHGRRAPGPGRLWIAPDPSVLLEIPGWRWQGLGVEARRVRAIRAAATVARRMEEAAAMTPAAAITRLRVVPGVGAWTAAEALQRAMGHPDAISVGDYHLADWVVHFFTGRARGSDDEMEQLLAPWAGQRQRVVRLIELAGLGKPRFGPRYSPLDITAL